MCGPVETTSQQAIWLQIMFSYVFFCFPGESSSILSLVLSAIRSVTNP